MKITSWWWIRHAPVLNPEGRVYGQRDMPADCTDAPAFARQAARLPKDAVWLTTQLQRTKATAAGLRACLEGTAEPTAEPELVEQSFGDWTSDATPLPRILLRPATFPATPKVLFAHEPGTSQSALYVVRPAPGMDEPGRAASVAIFRLLAGDFLSRLNAVIREEKGFSYGTAGDLLDVRRGGAISVSSQLRPSAI